MDYDEDKIYSLFDNAVKHEIKWSNHILGEDILGITPDSIEAYTKYLANIRLKSIGMNPLYPGFTKNPFRHLERFADTGGEGHVKGNFFETTITSYNMSTAVEGWDF